MDQRPPNLFRDEAGSTVIEYGLIAALVCIVLLSGLGMFHTVMDNMYSSIATQVGGAAGM